MRKHIGALLIIGWVLTGYTNHDGVMPLREYRTQVQCVQAAANYNVRQVWEGPQSVLPLLEGELFCEPDNSPVGYQAFPFGQWYKGQEYRSTGKTVQEMGLEE